MFKTLAIQPENGFFALNQFCSGSRLNGTGLNLRFSAICHFYDDYNYTKLGGDVQ
jgi:hypothetical protein